MRACDECYGVGCEVCNGLGWEIYEPRSNKMSAIKVEVYKYGQVTKVEVDGKFSHFSGNTVNNEIRNLKKLFETMVVENVEVVEKEK